MGGYGTMKYAARHPGLFQVAASFSGAVDTRYLVVGGPLGLEFFGGLQSGVWGDPIAQASIWQANNPTDLAADLAGTKLLVVSGNGLPGGAHENPQNAAGYAVENGIWQMNQSFVRALNAAGVPHTDLFYGPGQHDWPYWRDDLAWALPQILAAIAP